MPSVPRERVSKCPRWCLKLKIYNYYTKVSSWGGDPPKPPWGATPPPTPLRAPSARSGGSTPPPTKVQSVEPNNKKNII